MWNACGQQGEPVYEPLFDEAGEAVYDEEAADEEEEVTRSPRMRTSRSLRRGGGRE